MLFSVFALLYADTIYRSFEYITNDFAGENSTEEENQQGDIIAITNKDGEVVARYRYDAWGKVVAVLDADGADISSNAAHIANINPFRYRGYYYDAETGLYYLQSRYYDPETGRFINADVPEMLILSGYNLFIYCNNRPVNALDSTGYAALELAMLKFAAECVLMVALFYVLAKLVCSLSFLDGWNSFCNAVGNGLNWIGTTIFNGGETVRNWTKAQIKAATVALEHYKSFVNAQIKIRTKITRNSKTRYWLANVLNVGGYKFATISTPLSFNSAKNLASLGKSIFAVTKSEARTLANRFYGVSKAEKGAARDCCAQYWHYHIMNKKYKNQHIFYLF